MIAPTVDGYIFLGNSMRFQMLSIVSTVSVPCEDMKKKGILGRAACEDRAVRVIRVPGI